MRCEQHNRNSLYLQGKGYPSAVVRLRLEPKVAQPAVEARALLPEEAGSRIGLCQHLCCSVLHAGMRKNCR